MEDKLKELKKILAEVSDINGASALLGWDQQTYMPPGGTESRSQQLATLNRLAHVKFTDERVGMLLDELQPYAESLEPDSVDARLIQVTRREYDKQVKVPADWVADFSRVTSAAHQIWQEARQEDDFPKFQPYLERIVELRRQYAALFAPFEHVYDPLLDDYEPGMKTKDVQAIFAELRPQQVEIIQAIREQPQVDNSFLHETYNPQKQLEFGEKVVTRFGYDWRRGRQDKSAHPFTTGFGIDDVRITTRVFPNDASSALFSTMHEAGHAMYEQGINKSLSRTPLATGASLAVHESQSRMWENLVGRSYPFWEHFYPSLQETFPEQLSDVDLLDFYKAINKVEPSLIRVEADEATYNLHIMLRLEMEIALMEGALDVKDLPEAWNTRMEEYLGVLPPNDVQGVLQDVHWSGGLIGYFATYALGNLISVQLWDAIQKDIPDLEDQIRHGEFAGLLGWLRKNIHQYGAMFKPQELVERATGSKIDPAPYLQYLRQKYGEIYNL
jgi:carboxypeptidase Taq